MHCALRLLDKIEETGHSDANIKWSSHKDSDVLTDNRTFSNVINSSNSITVVVLVVVVVLAI